MAGTEIADRCFSNGKPTMTLASVMDKEKPPQGFPPGRSPNHLQ